MNNKAADQQYEAMLAEWAKRRATYSADFEEWLRSPEFPPDIDKERFVQLNRGTYLHARAGSDAIPRLYMIIAASNNTLLKDDCLEFLHALNAIPLCVFSDDTSTEVDLSPEDES